MLSKSERGMVANVLYNIRHAPVSRRLRQLVEDDFNDDLAREFDPLRLARWEAVTDEEDEE